MATLGPGLTSGTDHTHPNAAGMRAEGQALLDFFGAAGGP
jgi:lysophospholipase L1-like esterase